MKIKTLTFSVLTLLALTATPSLAQKLDEFGDTKSSASGVNMQNLPVINNADWRTGKANVPWSTPILVRDDFDGDYLAVLDRNYTINANNEESGIITNWSRRKLRIFSYDTVKKCGILVCTKTPVEGREANKVAIKAGKAVFRLTGDNGNFEITDEIAMALKTAPPGDTKIKVQFEESGVDIVNDIGKGTVEAWKSVYHDAGMSEKAPAKSTK
ncbi:MAG: hypothetical protein RLZZ511_1540 [Cyanobacteriota bacterium]|jgi:hypothetical protein